MLDAEASRVMMAGMGDVILGLAARGSILFSLAFLGTRIGRSLGPERRHTVWLVFILLLAALPAARLAAPMIRIPLLDPPAPAGTDAAKAVPAPPMPSVELGQPVAAADTGLRGDQRRPGAGGDRSAASWLPLAAAAVWLGGAVAAAARSVAGRMALRRVTRSRRARPGPAALLAALAGSEGVGRVSVLSHPDVTVPFTFGMFRPIIVLPRSWRRWSGEKLAAVLHHELAHLKRRDHWSDTVAEAACTILWFHPLAWIARGFLRREAELSCDRQVLARGIPRTGYAAALVDISRAARHTPFPLGGTALTGRSTLRERVAEVLAYPLQRGARAARLVRGTALALCAVAPVLLLSVSLRGTDPLYGVWQGRSASRPFYEYRLALNEDGSGETLLDAVPGLPTSLCRLVVDRRWKDDQGRTLYHLRVRWSSMPFMVYALVRLDASGRRFEMADSPTGYPEHFLGPPGSEKHLVYIRR